MCDPTGTTVLNPITGNPLGPTDQRSQIKTFNIAPAWNHLMSSNAVFTLGAWVRHDQDNYYPSNDPFADLGPLQGEPLTQLRFLTNAGLRGALVVRQGGPQPENRSHRSTHIPHRERRFWNCGSRVTRRAGLPGSD